MARSLALATSLLLSLLWIATAWAEPASSAATFQVTGKASVEPDFGNATSVAVTGGAYITVTTTNDEVNDDGDCSLREAIEAATSDSTIDGCQRGNGFDTVTIPPGNYALTLGQLELTGTVTLQGSITGATILDGNQADRIFYIHAGASVALLHLHIRNGHVPLYLQAEPAHAGNGGGVLNEGTTLIAYSTIDANLAGWRISPTPEGGFEGEYGGGIYNAGILTLTYSILSRNVAGYSECYVASSPCATGGKGGGIYNAGILDITNSTLSGNRAGDSYCSDNTSSLCASGGDGGGIYNEGSVDITNSTLSSNDAGSTLAPSPGVSNAPGGDGGGIYNEGILDITNSTLSSNEAGSSNCIFGRDGQGPCGFGGNGGGIFNLGTLTLDNTTVTNNSPGRGITPGSVGGIYNGNSGSTFKNNIIAGNSESDCGGTITSLGNNLFQSTAECSINGDFIHWAAHLEPLNANGGPTLTHALNPKSPAIDAGDCTDSRDIKVTVDQRGELRPQGEGCDIGAYESRYTSTFAISNTALPIIGR